ncbi:MAG: DUF192 domain-containing protein [Candidatus Omnitrophica bacterium]|nr:DUF192 domain-containing protein [Candidatus Omnitrophota bacterium]
MKIFNLTRQKTIASHGKTADTFFSRMKGLLGTKRIGQNEALIITRCKSIHMFFMSYSIDAIFVDEGNEVVGLVKNIKPWHLSPVFLRSSFVIESCPGIITLTQTALGDKIKLEE